MGASQERRIDVDAYHRMIEAGAFDDGARLELLRGVLCVMAPQGSRHAAAVVRLNRILVRAAKDDYSVRPRVPLTMGEDSEPEPDLAVVPMGDERSGRHPRTAEWVIEVANDSLKKDRQTKREIYATAGVREYWIVNLVHETIEVYRMPSPAGEYRWVRSFQADEPVTPLVFPALQVTLRDLIDD